MTTPDFPEFYDDEPEFDIALQDAAEARGITLDSDRLFRLTEAAETIHTINSYGGDDIPKVGYTSMDNDVWVEPAVHSDKYGVIAAKVDFAPRAEKGDNFEVGETDASPEHTTLFALSAIHDLQNYVLLVDAGVLEKPEVIHGKTNPDMAVFAERVGLFSDIARKNPDDRGAAHKAMREHEELEITGSFDDMSERVFSDDMKRVERLLTRRLAARQPSAALALNHED